MPASTTKAIQVEAVAEEDRLKAAQALLLRSDLICLAGSMVLLTLRKHFLDLKACLANFLSIILGGICNFLVKPRFGRNARISPIGTKTMHLNWEAMCGMCHVTACEAKRGRRAQSHRIGFTLMELLVTMAIIGILATLMFPAVLRTKQKAQGIYCLNNGRQLMVAMTIYTVEYRDLFPPNPDDGNTIAGHNWCSGVAGKGGPDEFNPDLLKDQQRSLLTPYLTANTAVFHCPGDQRRGMYQGNDGALRGKIVPASRTFSMNQAVGTICPGFDVGTAGINAPFPQHSGVPTLSVNGPWLNNQFNHRRDSPWITYGKFSTIRAPGPGRLWVLVDEAASGLNDAAFGFGMEQPIWIDAPGAYHNGGCGLAFADGHSESHQWLSKSDKHGHRIPITDPQDRRDWLWLRERTSAHISGTTPP